MNYLMFNSNVCPGKCKYKLIHHGLLKSVKVPKTNEFRQAFMNNVVCKTY